MTKARVPLWGNPQKSVEVERGATAGATIGVNVFNRDGSLFVPGAAATPAARFPVTLWRLIQEIPANVSGLAAVTTDGWFRKDGAAIAAREIADTDLPLLPDTGVGASLVKTTRDAYGRVAGMQAATTDDLTEGATNLYHTAERAQDAVGAAIAAGTGDGASLAYDDAGNAINVANTDKGSVAVATHEAAADPHPQYTTAASFSALAGSFLVSSSGVPLVTSTGDFITVNV